VIKDRLHIKNVFGGQRSVSAGINESIKINLIDFTVASIVDENTTGYIMLFMLVTKVI